MRKHDISVSRIIPYPLQDDKFFCGVPVKDIVNLLLRKGHFFVCRYSISINLSGDSRSALVAGLIIT